MSRSQGGFTLIELLITTALLGAVMGSAILFSVSSSQLHREASMRATAQTKARRILDRIVSEIAYAERDSLLPDATGGSGTNDIRFNRIEGMVGGVAVPGVTMRLWREPSPTDPDDGIDNDGNGLIDEGRLVLVRDDGGPAERSTVLVNTVRELFEGEARGNLVDENGNGVIDESGFFVHSNANLLTIGISIDECGLDGTSVVASVTATIAFRN